MVRAAPARSGRAGGLRWRPMPASAGIESRMLGAGSSSRLRRPSTCSGLWHSSARRWPSFWLISIDLLPELQPHRAALAGLPGGSRRCGFRPGACGSGDAWCVTSEEASRLHRRDVHRGAQLAGDGRRRRPSSATSRSAPAELTLGSSSIGVASSTAFCAAARASGRFASWSRPAWLRPVARVRAWSGARAAHGRRQSRGGKKESSCDLSPVVRFRMRGRRTSRCASAGSCLPVRCALSSTCQ